MREQLRFRLRHVASHGVDPAGRAAALGLLRRSADAVCTTTMRSVDDAAEARRAEARRRRREAEGW